MGYDGFSLMKDNITAFVKEIGSFQLSKTIGRVNSTRTYFLKSQRENKVAAGVKKM